MITGKQIAEARKAKGYTQAKLADEIGVSTEAVSKWEKDCYAPAPDKLDKLYRILGISYLDTGDTKGGRLFDETHMSAFLKGKLNDGSFPQALKALSFAKEKHEGQYRKPYSLNVPYVNHPLTMVCHMLALGIKDDALLAAALLHDVCEDCGVQPEELPVEDETREIVRLVTKPKPLLSEKKYYEAIAQNPKACLVKCVDRCNNLSGMAAAFSAEWIHDYIVETEKYYPKLLRVLKEQPEYNNSAWLLSYQIWSLVQTAKRIV